MRLGDFWRGSVEVTREVPRAGLAAVDVVEKTVLQSSERLEAYTAPVRESLFKRYPTLFTLLVTVGATATFLGLEQLFLRVEIFVERPWLLFLLGVVILGVTGRLYKKLG